MSGKATLSIATVALIAGLAASPAQQADAEEALSCLGTKADINIGGLYFNNFSGVQIVNKRNWISGVGDDELVFHICTTDSSKYYIIAKNDPGNAFNTLKYSRFEWVANSQHLYYCQQVYDAATPQAAADFTKTPAADASHPSDKGCGVGGKFPWTEMILVRK